MTTTVLAEASRTMVVLSAATTTAQRASGVESLRRMNKMNKVGVLVWSPVFVCAGVLDSSELNIKFHSRR